MGGDSRRSIKRVRVAKNTRCKEYDTVDPRSSGSRLSETSQIRKIRLRAHARMREHEKLELTSREAAETKMEEGKAKAAGKKSSR